MPAMPADVVPAAQLALAVPDQQHGRAADRDGPLVAGRRHLVRPTDARPTSRPGSAAAPSPNTSRRSRTPRPAACAPASAAGSPRAGGWIGADPCPQSPRPSPAAASLGGGSGWGDRVSGRGGRRAVVGVERLFGHDPPARGGRRARRRGARAGGRPGPDPVWRRRGRGLGRPAAAAGARRRRRTPAGRRAAPTGCSRSPPPWTPLSPRTPPTSSRSSASSASTTSVR